MVFVRFFTSTHCLFDRLGVCLCKVVSITIFLLTRPEFLLIILLYLNNFDSISNQYCSPARSAMLIQIETRLSVLYSIVVGRFGSDDKSGDFLAASVMNRNNAIINNAHNIVCFKFTVIVIYIQCKENTKNIATRERENRLFYCACVTVWSSGEERNRKKQQQKHKNVLRFDGKRWFRWGDSNTDNVD